MTKGIYTLPEKKVFMKDIDKIIKDASKEYPFVEAARGMIATTDKLRVAFDRMGKIGSERNTKKVNDKLK